MTPADVQAALDRLRDRFEGCGYAGDPITDLTTLERGLVLARHDAGCIVDDGATIEVVVKGHVSTVAAEVGEENTALRAQLAAATTQREQAERDLDTFVHAVPDPLSPDALHYDGCPYKPYADVPDWEEPESLPECTCAERHKGAYWKARWVLQGGAHCLALQQAEQQAQTLRDEAQWLWRDWEQIRTRMVASHERETETLRAQLAPAPPAPEST